MKKFLNSIFTNYKKSIPICLIIFIILLFIWGEIIKNYRANKEFAEFGEKIASSNENKVFNIDKIILCSNANAIDNSENKNVSSLSVYQYTDIAIYINNKNKEQELTKENTISELFIDNIEIVTSSDIGKQSLKYKNLMAFGSKETLSDYNYNDRIDFNVVYTNKENEEADYNEPNFYTDCSNPITLEYINQDLKNDYKITDKDNVSFDGKILKSAGIKIEDINSKIRFKINIRNNNNESFSSWVNFQIPLNDIYEGNSIKSKVLDKDNYRNTFFKM